MTLRARPYEVLVRIGTWLLRRERAAWVAAIKSPDDEQARRLRNRSDRLARLVTLCAQCPRKGAS